MLQSRSPEHILSFQNYSMDSKFAIDAKFISKVDLNKRKKFIFKKDFVMQSRKSYMDQRFHLFMYKIKDEKNQINKYLDHFSERENEKLELFLIVGQYIAWFKK